MTKEKILLVDDEELITSTLYYIFYNEFEVLTSNDPLNAIELLKKHDDIRVIVTDQMMPNMNGTELLEKASEINPKAYRIILSGYGESDDLQKYKKNGVIQTFIDKPWQAQELIDLIRSIIKRQSDNA